jgi:hypothetical protein
LSLRCHDGYTKVVAALKTTPLSAWRTAARTNKMGTALKEFRINFKNFAFLKNFRIKTLDPSPCLPLVDDNGDDVWGTDPVHPLPHGYV